MNVPISSVILASYHILKGFYWTRERTKFVFQNTHHRQNTHLSCWHHGKRCGASLHAMHAVRSEYVFVFYKWDKLTTHTHLRRSKQRPPVNSPSSPTFPQQFPTQEEPECGPLPSTEPISPHLCVH